MKVSNHLSGGSQMSRQKCLALLHFRTPLGLGLRQLSAAFFHDESSITIGGYESAIAPNALL